MRWGARSSVNNLDNHIRRSVRKGEVEELDEVRYELEVLLKHAREGFDEALDRRNRDGRDR